VTPYFEDELVTIYHGDAREVMAEIGPVGLVVTDPPYAFGRQRPEWRVTASIPIILAEAAHRVSKGGAMAVMSAASGRGVDYVLGAVAPILPFNRVLIWHKAFVNSAVAGPWRWDIVPVLWFGKASFGRPAASSLYESSGQFDPENGKHPSPLPIGLGRWLIEPYANATVLDPFMGTGTFMAAARQLGRKSIGIEIEERYCEIAARRCSQEVLGLLA
jgi:DNA modification methylase